MQRTGDDPRRRGAARCRPRVADHDHLGARHAQRMWGRREQRQRHRDRHQGRSGRHQAPEGLQGREREGRGAREQGVGDAAQREGRRTRRRHRHHHPPRQQGGPVEDAVQRAREVPLLPRRARDAIHRRPQPSRSELADQRPRLHRQPLDVRGTLQHRRGAEGLAERERQPVAGGDRTAEQGRT